MNRMNDQQIRLFIIKIYRTMSLKTVLQYQEAMLLEMKKLNTVLMFITQEVNQLNQSELRMLFQHIQNMLREA